eukprot:m.86245 g.86245  ORF g.86245 m.86245 type:complete len:410 (-) comp14868_c0_seq4:2562-3791(-)
MQCPQCEGRTEASVAQGNVICTECGFVLEEDVTVEQVQFQGESRTHVVGQSVDARGQPYGSASAFGRRITGTNELTTAQTDGLKVLFDVGSQIGFGRDLIDQSRLLYKQVLKLKLEEIDPKHECHDTSVRKRRREAASRREQEGPPDVSSKLKEDPKLFGRAYDTVAGSCIFAICRRTPQFQSVTMLEVAKRVPCDVFHLGKRFAMLNRHYTLLGLGEKSLNRSTGPELVLVLVLVLVVLVPLMTLPRTMYQVAWHMLLPAKPPCKYPRTHAQTIAQANYVPSSSSITTNESQILWLPCSMCLPRAPSWSRLLCYQTRCADHVVEPAYATAHAWAHPTDSCTLCTCVKLFYKLAYSIASLLSHTQRTFVRTAMLSIEHSGGTYIHTAHIHSDAVFVSFQTRQETKHCCH